MDHTSVAIDADTGRGWHKPVKGWSPKKVLTTDRFGAQSRHRSKGPSVSIGEACFEQLVMSKRPGWTKQTECAHVQRPLPERTRSGIARPSDCLGDREQGSLGELGDGELAARDAG
jgi:hypothetical protein